MTDDKKDGNKKVIAHLQDLLNPKISCDKKQEIPYDKVTITDCKHCMHFCCRQVKVNARPCTVCNGKSDEEFYEVPVKEFIALREKLKLAIELAEECREMPTDCLALEELIAKLKT